jgi:hypothetical protein
MKKRKTNPKEQEKSKSKTGGHYPLSTMAEIS